MKVLSLKGNALQERVKEENLERRTVAWKSLSSNSIELTDFPSMSEEELRNLTIGVYQLKLARSYTHEHLAEDGEYVIMVNDGTAGLLRARIQSRHTSSKTYLLWIDYSPAVINGWYCQCKAGARVVGTCAHVAAVIWYIGYARHVGTVRGVRNLSEYLEDAANVPIIVDVSSEGDSDPKE
ncbi:uncharacterized protein LOC117322192 [Pecten maximus]|uniref:uncharacterized protein LOC117322192 n=1 Tax=Pecten maximus TaxID=6579 RepID=UPI001458B63A|nr:uncharacterized protein LOC117322192 [Pecten maximus]